MTFSNTGDVDLDETDLRILALVQEDCRTALARIGERQALQWFRQGLVSENRHIVLESIQAIADEGITLLWPELAR